MTKRSPFKYFKTSPEIIRLAVTLYVRFRLLLRNVEDLLHERGIEISHETDRFWWHRFGPMFASEIRKRRIEGDENKPLAVASRRGFREDQWRAALPLARSITKARFWRASSRRPGTRKLH
jgi:hypothetical protein